MKCGFLPLSQEALICGEVSYHDYNGILVDAEERESLQRNLGPINKVSLCLSHSLTFLTLSQTKILDSSKLRELQMTILNLMKVAEIL